MGEVIEVKKSARPKGWDQTVTIRIPWFEHEGEENETQQTEEFTAYPARISADTVLGFASNSIPGELVYQLYREVLSDEDFQRFCLFIKTAKHGFTIGDLRQINDALIAWEADRPTQRPSSSQDGPPPTGT